MEPPIDMLDDARDIAQVGWLSDATEPCGNPCSYAVGRDGVTRIAPYGEPGIHCNRPFIAIYKGSGEVWRRIDATGAFITYAE